MAPETPTTTAPRPDEGAAPPPTAAASAIAPRWATRAEIIDDLGQRRTLVRVSDAEDALAATHAALIAIAEDLEPGEHATGLDVFRPLTITADEAPLWTSAPMPVPPFLAEALRGLVAGPCGCDDCRDTDPAPGDEGGDALDPRDEPVAGTDVPVDEA